MESQNQKFNTFLLQSGNFINYDNINKSMEKFDEELHFLKQKSKSSFYTPEYLKLLENLQKPYENKLDNLEYFKSQNAQVVNSMHYLFDVNSAIASSNVIDKRTIRVVNDSFLFLMKFYVNKTIDNSVLKEQLKLLDRALKQKSDLELEIFIEHIRINLKVIAELQKITRKVDVDYLKESLSAVNRYIKKSHKADLLKERVIVTVLFGLILVILVLLIIMNKKAIRLREELLGFRAAVENGYNTIIITDLEGKITYANETAQKETGYTLEELIGSNPRLLQSGFTDKKYYKNMYETLARGEKWQGKFINKRKDGSLYHEKAFIMPIFKESEIVSYMAIKLDITDFVEAQKEIEILAYSDSLTGLANRINIENYLQKRILVAKRERTKIALLFIDLDNFKNINDTLGHDVGDELLIQTAKRINHIKRDADILARLGGDEFVIIIENFENSNDISYMCQKILKGFERTIETSNHSLHISMSIGISLFPDDANDISELFKYADIAMYKAKDEGKNRFQYYKREFSCVVDNRLVMEQALSSALQNGEFYLMYQPQYLISTQKTVGLEALVRWNSPSLGNIPPDKFISICEDTGLIIELGLFIFRQACRDFLLFTRESQYLERISINVSAIQLYQDAFIPSIVAIIEEENIRPEQITLEITESRIMKNLDYSMKIFLALKEVGFSLSIDDFGTGYSSLNYLKKFPIDELKIDKSFVDNLPQNEQDVSIVRAILALSTSMGYYNVAEGIELIEQEEFLRDNGCLIGQGYLFSKPLKKEDLISFLD